MPSSFRQLWWVPGEAARTVTRADGTFVVRIRRYGVEPSGGCLVGLPLWAWTRARWQFAGKRRWSVETLRMNRTGVGGKRVGLELCDTRADARTRGEALLAELRLADG